MTVAVGSALAARFFARLGKRSAKAMPWEWMGLPLRQRLQVVRGWLVGDGSLDGKGTARFLKGVSISRPLIEQMRLTLLEAGLIPRVGAFSNENESWILQLTASDTSRLLAEPNAVECERWGRRISYAAKRTNVMAVPTESGLALKMNGSERVPYSGIVHNMHVDEDESYVVEGIAVHNCWIADQAVRRGGFSASFGDGEAARSPAEVAKHAQRVAALAEGARAADDGGASAPGDGARGNLGAVDLGADALWSAVPFYSR